MRLDTREVMLRAVLKKMEEVGMTDKPSLSDISSEKLLGVLINHFGDRIDVARQAKKAHDQGKKLTSELTPDSPDEAVLLAFDFGIELGMLLAKLEYELSAKDLTGILAKEHNRDKNRRNSEPYKEGRKEVIGYAARQALVRWKILDPEKNIRIGDMAKIIDDALNKKFPPDHPFHKHVPKGDGFEDVIRRWIRPGAPGYATRGGRPPKNK